MTQEPDPPLEAPPPNPAQTPPKGPPETQHDPPPEGPPEAPEEEPPGRPGEEPPLEARRGPAGGARITPRLSLLFGWGAMAPLALGAAAVWLSPGAVADWAVAFCVFWGGALLTFLAGVRRGLSFRTPEGPRMAEIGAMLWLFGLGVGALAIPDPLVSACLLLAGFLSLMALDPIAAKRGEAPPFFARLRPFQMAAPSAAFAAIVAALA